MRLFITYLFCAMFLFGVGCKPEDGVEKEYRENVLHDARLHHDKCRQDNPSVHVVKKESEWYYFYVTCVDTSYKYQCHNGSCFEIDKD